MARRKKPAPSFHDDLPVFQRLMRETDDALFGAAVTPEAIRVLGCAAAGAAGANLLVSGCPRAACRRSRKCCPAFDGKDVDALCPALGRAGLSRVFDACAYACMELLELLAREHDPAGADD
jgi:hypothetical protein